MIRTPMVRTPLGGGPITIFVSLICHLSVRSSRFPPLATPAPLWCLTRALALHVGSEAMAARAAAWADLCRAGLAGHLGHG